ncbi:hypothetical protein DXF88_25480, partial [Enterobacter roggenkampii]
SYVDKSLTINEYVISSSHNSWIPTIIPVIIGIIFLHFYVLVLMKILSIIQKYQPTRQMRIDDYRIWL